MDLTVTFIVYIRRLQKVIDSLFNAIEADHFFETNYIHKVILLENYLENVSNKLNIIQNNIVLFLPRTNITYEDVFNIFYKHDSYEDKYDAVGNKIDLISKMMNVPPQNIKYFLYTPNNDVLIYEHLKCASALRISEKAAKYLKLNDGHQYKNLIYDYLNNTLNTLFGESYIIYKRKVKENDRKIKKEGLESEII